MGETATSWLGRYQPYRRRAEIAFWVLVLLVQMLANSVTSWIDMRNVPFAVPLTWEWTSNLTIGLLIPVLIAFERRFPLRWETLARNLPWHLAGTLGFCLAHVLGMLALRKLAYVARGSVYETGNLVQVLGYEYLKDLRSYVLILCAVLGYRLLLLRMQGEARVLDAPEPAAGAQPPVPVARPERFLVRKLRKEFLIAAADIEWLQAEGNYVGLRVNGHDYLLRSTLASFLEQLDPARFVQVHRSYVVNLDRIAEIEPTDGGDARLRMKDGSEVPCSRRYRAALGSR